MEQEVNVRKGKNLVCKHRNEISREIQNRLKEKVSIITLKTEDSWGCNDHKMPH